jgi:peptidoglycan/xylan/chitin deacetylase (PgdA/CDA1 family)
MRFLSENDYSAVNLQDLQNCFDTNNKLTRKFAIITFDDGYHDFYAGAFPILQKYHLTATVFLPTSFIGNEGLQLKGKKHLSWTEVKALSQRGITFGSHTVTHPHLNTLKDEEVEDEIKRSKETIEDKLGQVIDTFSYPFKFPEENRAFTKLLKDLLQRHGYKYGVSTRIGTTSKNDEVYFMKRIPVNSGDDISLFQAKLEGGYDWIYPIQRLSKFMGSII